EPEGRHQADGAVGNLSEPRITRADITDQKSCQQRADARAQRELDATDRKTDENANDAAEEDREAQHNEIDAGTRRDHDADAFGRVLHDGFRSDDAKQVAALQDDAGG